MHQPIRSIFKFENFKIGILILITTSFALASCQTDDKQPAAKPKKIPLVKIQEVSTSRIVSSTSVTGTVQPNIETEVMASDDGIIESLFARENQYVEDDRLIAIINPTNRVSLISSNIKTVETLERKLETLTEGSEEYQKVQNDLQKAKADLEYAKEMYQTIPVVSPMSGMVTKRWLEEGSQVSAKDVIVTITDMNSLVIKAEVNEKYFEAIKQGVKIPVILNAYPNDTLMGTISLIYPHINPVSRSVKFDIKLKNFNKKLLPGMMAEITIPVTVIKNAVTVPEYAVLTSPDNKNFVFRVNTDSIAIRQIVQTGITSEDKIQILNGLNANERIVVSGQELLKDGMKVKIMR
jgi:membrane fusion protein, multidrug efflux system